MTTQMRTTAVLLAATLLSLLIPHDQVEQSRRYCASCQALLGGGAHAATSEPTSDDAEGPISGLTRLQIPWQAPSWPVIKVDPEVLSAGRPATVEVDFEGAEPDSRVSIEVTYADSEGTCLLASDSLRYPYRLDFYPMFEGNHAVVVRWDDSVAAMWVKAWD